MQTATTAQAEMFGDPPRHVKKCRPERLLRGKFASDAMGFLVAWVKKHGPKPFSAESVTLAALQAGVAPPDLRHWGEVFQRAAREGYIRRSSAAFRRSMGNATLTLGWEAA